MFSVFPTTGYPLCARRFPQYAARLSASGPQPRLTQHGTHRRPAAQFGRPAEAEVRTTAAIQQSCIACKSVCNSSCPHLSESFILLLQCRVSVCGERARQRKSYSAAPRRNQLPFQHFGSVLSTSSVKLVFNRDPDVNWLLPATTCPKLHWRRF